MTHKHAYSRFAAFPVNTESTIMSTATVTKTEGLLTEVDHFSAHNYHPLPVVLERGEGSWVWDVEGTRYLDMLSAYSAVNQGHRHPAIIDAAVQQMGMLTLTSRAFHNDQMGPFLKTLCDVTGFEKALPMNTGALKRSRPPSRWSGSGGTR